MPARVLTPELMDDPGIDRAEHAAALRGLARLNVLSRAAAPLVAAVCRAVPVGRVEVLDVATGSGDVCRALVLGLRRRGYDCAVRLIDKSPLALEQAAARFQAVGLAVQTEVRDALSGDLPEADIVVSTLFMHHLTEDEARGLLADMGHATRRLALVSDLRRSTFGTLLATVVPRVMTRSHVVHTDAVLSARAAFTVDELRACADDSGMHGARVRPVWPGRMLLAWEHGS